MVMQNNILICALQALINSQYAIMLVCFFCVREILYHYVCKLLFLLNFDMFLSLHAIL